MGTPDEALEQLRGLDRQLLALQGDLKTRLENQFSIGVAGIGKTFRIPDAGEMARIEQELRSIYLTLAQTAEPLGLPFDDELALEISSTDAIAAYDAIEKRVAHLRPQVRRAFETLRAKHPALADAPDLADGTEYLEPVTGDTRRRFSQNAAIAVVVVPLVLALAYWAYAHDQNKRRAAAVELCAKPSPCEGDQMEIAHATPVRYQNSMGNAGLVLFRHDADCSREVEVYYRENGSFSFRGSAEDPDDTRRAEFLEARSDWWKRHEIASRVSCERADEL